jgi:hypothetical protein
MNTIYNFVNKYADPVDKISLYDLINHATAIPKEIISPLKIKKTDSNDYKGGNPDNYTDNYTDNYADNYKDTKNEQITIFLY